MPFPPKRRRCIFKLGSCPFRSQASSTLTSAFIESWQLATRAQTSQTRSSYLIGGLQQSSGHGAERSRGAKPVRLPVEKLRKSDGRLAPLIHSNHGDEIRTTTGCHGRVPRGFDSKRNALSFRYLGLKIFLAGAEGLEQGRHNLANRESNFRRQWLANDCLGSVECGRGVQPHLSARGG